jgi:hypothetical protein
MKSFVRFLFLIFVFALSSNMYGQITNLLVNGSSTNFTMASGGEISWSYSLPVGGTALLQIWIDVNSNTVLDPGTDMMWQAFYQTDGQSGHNGPPDMDDSVNGRIRFAQEVGLAPGKYIMSFSNNSLMVTIPGTVTPMVSPVFTISGHITVPAGQSAHYLVISLENNGGGFWNAITDVSGNFSVQINGDTSGNPWRLSIDNPYILSPSVQSPDRITLTLDAGVATTYPGNNFTFTQAAAEVKGTVKDDDGNPLIGIEVYIDGNNGTLHRNVLTDPTGFYRLGFVSNELPTTSVWLGAGNSEDNSMVSAGVQLPTVNSGNVVTKNLTVYRTNSTITGNVLLNGIPPFMSIEIDASISDTGFVRTFAEPNGNYTLHVSNKLYNYSVGSWNLPPNYMGYFITAHPGQTNVNFNFNLTDVKEDHTIIPSKFNLAQNFPNPFNPSTKISWQSPIGSWQTLKVYNVLGNEVATLVDEYRPAASYEIEFDAAQLSSGIYFYKIQAGSFVETKKMVLLR